MTEQRLEIQDQIPNIYHGMVEPMELEPEVAAGGCKGGEVGGEESFKIVINQPQLFSQQSYSLGA